MNERELWQGSNPTFYIYVIKYLVHVHFKGSNHKHFTANNNFF